MMCKDTTFFKINPEINMTKNLHDAQTISKFAALTKIKDREIIVMFTHDFNTNAYWWRIGRHIGGINSCR